MDSSGGRISSCQEFTLLLARSYTLSVDMDGVRHMDSFTDNMYLAEIGGGGGGQGDFRLKFKLEVAIEKSKIWVQGVFFKI